MRYHEGATSILFALPSGRVAAQSFLAHTGESWHYSSSNASRSYYEYNSSRALRAVALCVLTLLLGARF